MVAIPRVVEDLLADVVEHLPLVGVLGTLRDVESVLVGQELVMGPERVIETEIPVLLGIIHIFGYSNYGMYPTTQSFDLACPRTAGCLTPSHGN